jgi:hypothetical protein
MKDERKVEKNTGPVERPEESGEDVAGDVQGKYGRRLTNRVI